MYMGAVLLPSFLAGHSHMQMCRCASCFMFIFVSFFVLQLQCVGLHTGGSGISLFPPPHPNFFNKPFPLSMNFCNQNIISTVATAAAELIQSTTYFSVIKMSLLPSKYYSTIRLPSMFSVILVTVQQFTVGFKLHLTISFGVHVLPLIIPRSVWISF